MPPLVFDNRRDALVALKSLHIGEVMRYRKAIILRGLHGYCLRDMPPRRWFASPLTVLAVADGFDVPRHPVYQVICANCYSEFEADFPDATYCSPKCKQKAYRKRIKAERSA